MIEISTILGAIAGIVLSVWIIWHKGLKPLVHGVKQLARIADAVQDVPQLIESVSSLENEVSQMKQLLSDHLKENGKK